MSGKERSRAPVFFITLFVFVVAVSILLFLRTHYSDVLNPPPPGLPESPTPVYLNWDPPLQALIFTTSIIKKKTSLCYKTLLISHSLERFNLYASQKWMPHFLELTTSIEYDITSGPLFIYFNPPPTIYKRTSEKRR